MKLFLQVRTFDCNYALVAPKAPVTVALDNGPAAPMPASGGAGQFEVELPGKTFRIVVAVDEPGIWPIAQGLDLRQGDTPTLKWEAAQGVAARNTETFRRGQENVVVLNLVLTQLQDVRGAVDGVVGRVGYIGIPPLGQPFPMRHVRDLNTPILAPEGKGWLRLRQAPEETVPGGALYFAESKTTPKLFACWVPPGALKTPGGVPFHVMLHPSASHLTRDYPWNEVYIHLIGRYLVDPVDGRQEHQTKAMIPQSAHAAKKAVLVFPVGSPIEYFGSFTQQASMLRTLQELAYFLQRMEGGGLPTPGVGRVAVSAFSFGAEAISTLLASPHAPFLEKNLREIYGLDLHRPEALIKPICDQLKAWYQGGKDGRRLRIYTTNGNWPPKLADLEPGVTTVKGPGGSLELDGPSSTVLLTPQAFFTDIGKEFPWQDGMNELDHPPTYFDWVHHLMPALFMEHALKRSGFADR